MATAPERLGSAKASISCGEWEYLQEKRAYQCRICVCEEAEGGYSAFAIRLPGVVSQGESLEEVLANIEDACREVIAEYLESGEIPWQDAPQLPEGSIQRWIVVNV